MKNTNLSFINYCFFFSVPDNWDMSLLKGVHKVKLPTNHKDYQDVEAAFRKTAPNQIVRIERIQNKEIYELYNVKRQLMMNKYGSNFTGKELMLFHGTSAENIEKINAGGLNRSYAGIHGNVLTGVLFVYLFLKFCFVDFLQWSLNLCFLFFSHCLWQRSLFRA